MRMLLIIWQLIFLASAYGQSYELKKNIQVADYSMSEVLGTPKAIHISQHSALSKSNPQIAISELLKLNPEELQETQSTQLSPSVTIKRYQRSHQGIPIPHADYTAIIEHGTLTTIHAEHYDQIRPLKSAALSEKKALRKALQQIKSNLYAWEATEKLLKTKSLSGSQRKALELALQQDYPTGELVYIRDYASKRPQLELAYEFVIESVKPEYRDRVYVSATDGRVLLRDPLQKHTHSESSDPIKRPGQGDTRYSGWKEFPTTRVSIDTFELIGREPLSGILCETRSLEGLGGTPVSTPGIVALSQPIQDGDETDDPCLTKIEIRGEAADDRWRKEEHRKVVFGDLKDGYCCQTYTPGLCSEVQNDDIAIDAHWGAAMVARYWQQIHGRHGYDDAGSPLLSFVHHGEGYDNASWNGLYMKYGDGSYQGGHNAPTSSLTSNGPLVSLDVCAHEIGHAICTSTSDLVYSGESGAMNEALSDIWAACIEQYVLDSIDSSIPYDRWGIGEQIDERDGGSYGSATSRALRWMDHPPAENNPDTYGAGTWWQDPDCASPSVANDFCGIHFNSGVLNKWFYLLTVGSGQPYSPGNAKPAADDEINDKGNTYSVTGIGIRKSEKITYGAELLLMPNARFVDMRAATIDIARALYGPCSPEVEQTVRAWYAVGVGEDWGACGATIEFNQFNLSQISERSEEIGCEAQQVVSIGLHSYLADTVVTFTMSGNAIEGVDYEVCTPTLAFSGSEAKTLDLIIYDDQVEEEDDTIIIEMSGGGYYDIDTLIIINDDGIPAVGGETILFAEDFSTDDGSWRQETVNPASQLNEWFIDDFNSDQAHISFPTATATATYMQLIESHVRLVSPEINAIGRQNVRIEFDFQVGGERDLVDSTALFDFGTFQISEDGFSWTDVKEYVGAAAAGGAVPVSGRYSLIHPELANKTFYLGFEWQNDALNGSAYSFSIDNVEVTGEGLEIATDSMAMMEATVPADSKIPFISDQNQLIGVIAEANNPLGCTQLSISAADGTLDYTVSQCLHRSTKVYSLQNDHSSDSLLMTLYYAESEIDGWSEPTTLNIIAVKSEDIDQEHNGYRIIDHTDIEVIDERDAGEGYMAYSFYTSSEYISYALTDRPSTPQAMMVEHVGDSGVGSLRSLVEDACPMDTIFFSPMINNDTIELTACDITVPSDLIFMGNGPAQTYIKTDGLDQIFGVSPQTNIQYYSLHLIDGSDSTSTSESCNEGSYELYDVEVSGEP